MGARSDAEYKIPVTQDASRPDSPPPVEHRAPPRDERRRSHLGTWALVLSLVFSVLSMMVGFAWIWVLPAVVFATWAVFRINPALQKGHGLALLGLVLAVLGGIGAYGCASWVQGKAELLGRGVLAAASSKNEPQKLDGWLTEKARADGQADVIRQRYAAVVALVGPYQKELAEESSTRGSRPYLIPPVNVVEIGQKIGDALVLDPADLWVRAQFRDEEIHVRIQWDHDDIEAVKRLEMGGSQHDYAVVKDVRFYRAEADAEADGPEERAPAGD